jgi:hypothetical protein
MNQYAQSNQGGSTGHLVDPAAFGRNLAETRAPQISTQLEILQKEIACQRDIIDRLAQKIQPVMSFGAQKVDGLAKDSPKNEPTCPLAAGIQNISAQISGNSSVLSDLLERIEV